MANIRFQVTTHASPAILLASFVAKLQRIALSAKMYQELCIFTMHKSAL